MYIGLTLTSASSFQMLRGSVIIFTGVLSRLILGHKLRWIRWFGILLVFLGLVVVGLTDMFYSGKDEKPQGRADIDDLAMIEDGCVHLVLV